MQVPCLAQVGVKSCKYKVCDWQYDNTTKTRVVGFRSFFFVSSFPIVKKKQEKKFESNMTSLIVTVGDTLHETGVIQLYFTVFFDNEPQQVATWLYLSHETAPIIVKPSVPGAALRQVWLQPGVWTPPSSVTLLSSQMIETDSSLQPVSWPGYTLALSLQNYDDGTTHLFVNKMV